MKNKSELLQLGPGRHYGEWWGQGIQRNYGLARRIFSLFDTKKWDNTSALPSCCSVAPIILSGIFDAQLIERAFNNLRIGGSLAAPGFKDPEGIVIFHISGGVLFKKTFKNDDIPKSLTNEE